MSGTADDVLHQWAGSLASTSDRDVVRVVAD